MALAPLILPYKSLARCGLEELSVHQRTARITGGVAFARKDDQSEKAKARQQILNLFTPEVWPGQLNMLTLPGIHWWFERMAFGTREPGWKSNPPQRTHFTCLENDRSIFHASLMKMPGLHAEGSLLRQIDHRNAKWAERGFCSPWIAGYYFGNVDDFLPLGDQFDAAWLDYTGPMSIERLRLIRAFWQTCVSSTLVVTSLKARWNRQTSDALQRNGGLGAWMRKHIEGDVLHEIEYQDGAPMHQIAFRKGAVS